MTPERKEWWDSLPAEEKRVRKAIKKRKWNLKEYKYRLTHGLRIYKPYYENEVRKEKFIIKALRKQIAMRPIWTATLLGNFYKCPRCTKNVWGNYQHCPECGQKLRWDCGQKLKLRCQQ